MRLSNRNGADGARRRLGLFRPPDRKKPFMTPLALAARTIGGKAEFLNLARLTNDERVMALVRCWDRLSRSDQKYISLDDLCTACDIAPEELFGAVVTAAHANGYDASLLLAAVFNYLALVEATIEEARKEGGSRQRRRILAQASLISY